MLQQSEGCSNCSTDDETVTERRTQSGPKSLCVDCYADVLSKETRLSNREAEVYAYSSSGFSNEDTATELGIDSSTVASHLASVRHKHEQARTLSWMVDPVDAITAPIVDGENLEPGAVVRFSEPYMPASSAFDSGEEYRHGIVRRVLTRSNDGVPTRVAVYPVNLTDGNVSINSSRDMPSVIDKSTEFIDVVFPVDTLLKDLPVHQEAEQVE